MQYNEYAPKGGQKAFMLPGIPVPGRWSLHK